MFRFLPSATTVCVRISKFEFDGFSVPADAERELLRAGLDPVLGLHVGHELRALAVDGEDGVAWTQVTQGRLAAWRHLEGNIHTHTHTQEKKEPLEPVSSCQ